MYRVHLDENDRELVTRYKKSTALHNHYVPDRTVDDVPMHSHPTEISASNYGVRPVLDYRASSPVATTNTVTAVKLVNPDELWSSDKIIAVSDGSLDTWTGTSVYALVPTNSAQTASAKGTDNIWTNPKHMSAFRAELA